MNKGTKIVSEMPGANLIWLRFFFFFGNYISIYCIKYFEYILSLNVLITHASFLKMIGCYYILNIPISLC